MKLELKIPHPSTGPAVYISSNRNILYLFAVAWDRKTRVRFNVSCPVKHSATLYRESAVPAGEDCPLRPRRAHLRAVIFAVSSFSRRRKRTRFLQPLSLITADSIVEGGSAGGNRGGGGRSERTDVAVGLLWFVMRQHNDRGMEMLRALGDRLTAVGKEVLIEQADLRGANNVSRKHAVFCARLSCDDVGRPLNKQKLANIPVKSAFRKFALLFSVIKFSKKAIAKLLCYFDVSFAYLPRATVSSISVNVLGMRLVKLYRKFSIFNVIHVMYRIDYHIKGDLAVITSNITIH